MNLVMLLSLGVGVLFVSAGALWFFARPKSDSATDLGSISRNWITEHRNDLE
jgi:hypothetical protein